MQSLYLKKNFFKKLFILLVFLVLILINYNSRAYAAQRRQQVRGSYDVIIGGGGFGGIAAAIQAARMGASVLIAEPSELIGGQAIAAGVSTMDDFSRIKSGLYLELITRMKNYYDRHSKSMGTCYWDSRTTAFEPRIGLDTLLNMIHEVRIKNRGTIDVFLNSKIVKVHKDKNKIKSVTLKTPGWTRDISCKVLIDATEYGDILPLAGAAYRAGNSSSPFINSDAMIQDITWVAVIRRYSGGVPDNLRPRNPLPGYELAKRNYEHYVTADGSNFKYVYPVELPVNFASHNAYRGIPDSSSPWSYDASRSNWQYITKTSVNWGNDYPGTYGWEGKRGLPVSYLEDEFSREALEREALIKTLHFIYYIQNELGEEWSVADDEYNLKTLPKAAQNLPREWQEIARRMPPIPYVRESRRVIGKYTLTSEELLQNSLSYRDGHTSREFYDAIAIGGYILDLHGANTDGDMEWNFDERAASQQLNRPRGPFQVPLRTLIPAEVDGLIAAEKNLSMSRLSAGALRLQPICMMTGQAAGALAALSALNNIRPRDVAPARVQWELVNSDVVLSLCKYSDVPPEHKVYKSVQICSLYGLIEPKEYPHNPSYKIDDLDDPVLAMAIIKGQDKGVFGVDEMITRRDAVSMIEKARKALNINNKWDSPSDRSEVFITRGDFAKALLDGFNLSSSKSAPLVKNYKSPFKASRHRQAEDIAKIAPLGILDVYKNDKDFKFGRPVTKGEATDMVVRAMAAAGI